MNVIFHHQFIVGFRLAALTAGKRIYCRGQEGNPFNGGLLALPLVANLACCDPVGAVGIYQNFHPSEGNLGSLENHIKGLLCSPLPVGEVNMLKAELQCFQLPGYLHIPVRLRPVEGKVIEKNTCRVKTAVSGSSLLRI